jgi:Type IV secretory pathway, VirD4 components
MPPRSRTSPEQDVGTILLIAAVFGVAGVAALLWAGGAAARLLSGRGLPHASTLSGLRTLAHPGNPARGWRTPMPGPVEYWTVTALLLTVVGLVVILLLRWWYRGERQRRTDVRAVDGLATRADVKAHASAKALLRRADVLRPSLPHATPETVGYRLGTSRGIGVWTSVEDSLVVLGPPRSGKGLHVVIPMILDAPGAVITTSTRPDNLAATFGKRRGPVAVFDPQGLAPKSEDGIRWSPIRGCEDPQTAMIRARALAAASSEQVDNRGFWQAQTESAIRAFLHAAALDGRGAAELYRWSLDPAAAGEAVRVLNASGRAAPGWADALDAVINGDPRTRDNSWAGIRIALSPLADPRVLSAVTPALGRDFDPKAFLTQRGTLYLLGTASGVGAAANLVAAFIEDVLDVARRLAAAAPTTRLDPPLALLLDEAANYALPSLPSLISEGGGSGITTVAVLQSLAQARARWGEHEGAAIWDAASVKVILGGSTNARDLQDLAALIGERDETIDSISRDHRGQRSVSSSVRRVPILDTGRLRTLPFGTGIVLHRAVAPIVADLIPWTDRSQQAPVAAETDRAP